MYCSIHKPEQIAHPQTALPGPLKPCFSLSTGAWPVRGSWHVPGCGPPRTSPARRARAIRANMCSMTSQGHPYARIRRALKTGNATIAAAAARDLHTVSLSDALELCLLYRDDPER